ncbi:MAG TPA: GGDEF domain-containing protein [Geminicoccaceae bacterium]|nr:GGDEF domain-containing protein [Geminicoccaceae bacterium]
MQRFLPRGVAPGEPDWGGFAGRLVEIVARRADGAHFPAELSVCLGGGAGGRIALVRLADVSGRAGRLAELERRALHDLLTGLPNRCLLDDRLTQELRLARRSGQPLAVLMLDLDRFKQVNDRCGHQVGDRLLQAVAGRLRATMRTCDTLGRLGGDEFLAVLPAPTGRRVACRVAGRLVTALRPPIRLDGASFRVGLSVGIAIWPEHGPEPATLLARADGAMYRAKRERSGFRLCRG